MFAWAKNAPPTTLPQGVSFLVDPGQRRYLVLQVEFLESWGVKRRKKICYFFTDSLREATARRGPYWSEPAISES